MAQATYAFVCLSLPKSIKIKTSARERRQENGRVATGALPAPDLPVQSLCAWAAPVPTALL